MNEDSRLSSSQQPSTSTMQPSGYTVSSTASGVYSENQKTSVCGEQSRQQEQPSTSKVWKDESYNFGYTDALPFAPWRRKRYGLTVQGLHEEIVDMYHWIKPNDIESRLRIKVFEKVRDSVLRQWKDKPIKISMFGSLRTNLFLPTSDIDVLVECEEWLGASTEANRNEMEMWLTETAKGLDEDEIADSIAVYTEAFVPIIKMIDRDTKLSIDISFNTVQGVRAASYIAKVKEEFPLIEPLVLLLKQFLHYRNLNQTYSGGLSSYGLVLLLVNFFQLYALNMRHRTIHDRGVNLGHLLLKFLELYSLEFNYEDIGISPGQCCYIPKAASGGRYGLKQAQPGNLALEDPLLISNDVGRSTYNFSSIANAFGQALQILLVAVTMRERKGRNQLAMKVYKGSLLHMIMPFTYKELTYRNWLMSGVLRFQKREVEVKYDLNHIHNTLVSPVVDLSRYTWLRRGPAGSEKRHSKQLQIVNPAEAGQEPTVKDQLIMQLLEKQALEEKRESEKKMMVAESPIDQSTSSTPLENTETDTESGDTQSESSLNPQDDNDDELIITGPPLPTSTASVNTSATVSTATSISERGDTDSPGPGSSIGVPSSEDEDVGMSNMRKMSVDGTISVQFKKPFSEVVAQSNAKTAKELSKRTQTNFDERKIADAMNHQFMNAHNQSYQSRPHQNGYQDSRNLPLDYAAAAASGSHKYRSSQSYTQRNQRYQRNHSQGSDTSDSLNRDRWNGNSNQMTRGRRGGRAPSNSSNHSRHSSDSRSRGRGMKNRSFRPTSPNPVLGDGAYLNSSRDHDNTLTEECGNDSTLTSDGCRKEPPRKYADAVKKKTSVSSIVDQNVLNGNGNGKHGISSTVYPMTPERSYRNAVAVPSSASVGASQSNLRKENECGLDVKSAASLQSDMGNHQPQLVPVVNRLQR